MSRPRSPRKAPDSASCFVRWSADEFMLIRKAMDIQAAGVIGGNSITPAGFARAATLIEAQRIVERKK